MQQLQRMKKQSAHKQFHEQNQFQDEQNDSISFKKGKNQNPTSLASNGDLK